MIPILSAFIRVLSAFISVTGLLLRSFDLAKPKTRPPEVAGHFRDDVGNCKSLGSEDRGGPMTRPKSKTFVNRVSDMGVVCLQSADICQQKTALLQTCPRGSKNRKEREIVVHARTAVGDNLELNGED